MKFIKFPTLILLLAAFTSTFTSTLIAGKELPVEVVQHVIVLHEPEIEEVLLEDGSAWSVIPSDLTILQNEWDLGEPVFLCQNTSWLKGAPYRIVSVKSGRSVAVHPAYGTSHRWWLKEEDDRLMLQDYSHWKVSNLDRRELSNWSDEWDSAYLGDSIYVGYNADLFTWGNPYILINLTTGGYVRAQYTGGWGNSPFVEVTLVEYKEPSGD